MGDCRGGGLGGVDGGSMGGGAVGVVVGGSGRLLSFSSVLVVDARELVRLLWYRCSSRLISCFGKLFLRRISCIVRSISSLGLLWVSECTRWIRLLATLSLYFG